MWLNIFTASGFPAQVDLDRIGGPGRALTAKPRLASGMARAIECRISEKQRLTAAYADPGADTAAVATR